MFAKPVTLRLLAAVALATPAAVALLPRATLAAEVPEDKMYILDKVEFNGNQLVSSDALTEAAGLQHGQKINIPMVKDAFQRVIDEYTKEKVNGTITPTVSARGTQMTVVFQITGEAPVQTTVIHTKPILDHETFTGNVKISSDKLLQVLTIKPGTQVTTEMITADRDAISSVYKKANEGVSIAPKYTTSPDGHIDLNFELVEGNPKTK